MVVPPKHPKMIIFSRIFPWLLGTTILGNLHIWNFFLIGCYHSQFMGVNPYHGTVDGNQKSGKFTSWGEGSFSHYL